MNLKLGATRWRGRTAVPRGRFRACNRRPTAQDPRFAILFEPYSRRRFRLVSESFQRKARPEDGCRVS